MTSSAFTDPVHERVARAADRLILAARTGVACAPVRDLIGSTDAVTAYAVQQLIVSRRLEAGGQTIGRKIGLTSPAVQAQLGVDQPDFGVLFGDMHLSSGDPLPADSVLQPRAEAEIAFVLGADLIDGPLGPEQVRAAIDHAVAAVEVCGSRIINWDITFGDTVADNASSGMFVLGTRRLPIEDLVPREVAVALCIDGVEVSTGVGSACLGDPLAAVGWLARRVRELGQPLCAGELILSGALGPMKPLYPGAAVEAHFTDLGSVSFTCAQAQNPCL